MWYINKNELYHHGILGMHWGVRNGPPYPLGAGDHSSSEKKAEWRKSLDKSKQISQQKIESDLPHTRSKLTEEQKKIIKNVLIGTAAAVGISGAIYFAYRAIVNRKMLDIAIDAIKKADLEDQAAKIMSESIDDVRTVLKSGDVLHRMSAYANVDYSKLNNPLYTAYTDKDIAKYMVHLKDWSGTGKRYDVTFKVLQDITVPSEKKAIEIFQNLWDNDPKYRRDLEALLRNSYSEIYHKKGTSKAVRDKVNKTLENPFLAGMYSFVRKNEPAQQTLIDEFKKHGYNGIMDYFDIKTGMGVESPLVVFNPSSTLIKVGEKFVDHDMKMAAQELLFKDILPFI